MSEQQPNSNLSDEQLSSTMVDQEPSTEENADSKFKEFIDIFVNKCKENKNNFINKTIDARDIFDMAYVEFSEEKLPSESELIEEENIKLLEEYNKEIPQKPENCLLGKEEYIDFIKFLRWYDLNKKYIKYLYYIR